MESNKESDKIALSVLILFFLLLFGVWWTSWNLWIKILLTPISFILSCFIIGNFLDAIVLRLKNKRYYFLMGKIAEKRKNTSAAIKYYLESLKKSTKVAALPGTAIYLLGNYLSQNNEYERQAIDVYLRYIELFPLSESTVKTYSFLEELCKITETQKPIRAVRLGNTININITKDYAQELNEKVIKANSNLDWAYFNLGLCLLLNASAENAIENFTKAIELNPQRTLSYYWLGKAYVSLNDLKTAQEYYRKFITLCPNSEDLLKQAEANFVIGKLLIGQIEGYPDQYDRSLQEHKDKIEKARIYFENAISQDRANAEYAFNYAKVLSAMHRHGEAVEAYKATLEIDRNNCEYLIGFAQELNSFGKYREAETVCRRIINLSKEMDPDIINTLITAFYHQKKYTDMIHEIESNNYTIERFENSIDPIYFIARSYSLLDRFDESIKWYKAFIKHKKCTDALYYLGCALAHIGDYKNALKIFLNFIGDEDAYKSQSYLQCGHIYYKLGQEQNAEEYYLKAYAISRDNVETLTTLGAFYYNVGQHENSLAYLDGILTQTPDHNRARFIKGLIFEKQGCYGQAIGEYSSALSDNNISPQSHLRLGIVYSRKSDYSEAIEHLEKSYQSGLRSDDLLNSLGMSYFHIENYEKALIYLDELLKRYPEDIELVNIINQTRYLLGHQLMSQCNYDKAIEEWEECLQENSRDEELRKDLAEAYCRAFLMDMKGYNGNKAQRKIEKANEYDPNNTRFIFLLGLFYYNTGRYEESIDQFNRLLTLNPQDTCVKYHMGLSLLCHGQKVKGLEIFKELTEDNNGYARHAAWIVANERIKEEQYQEATHLLEA